MTQTKMFPDTEQKFNEFIRKNPKAVELFEKLTFDLIEKKETRIGAKAIIENMRWNHLLVKTEQFKINNSYAPYFSRNFMVDHPQYLGLFKTKALKT